MIDFRKDSSYKANTTPEIIDVPEMLFVMADGKGAPDGSEEGKTEFQQAMQVIYGIVYTIKFWGKRHTPPAGYDAFPLAPLEALWWTTSGQAFDLKNPKDWQWTVMVRLPDFVTAGFFKAVVDEVASKKQSDIYRVARLERFKEGPSVQILHIGPYDTETSNIQLMHTFAREQGYELHGRHHELYFGDPRRTDPSKLRTILRQPVRRPA